MNIKIIERADLLIKDLPDNWAEALVENEPQRSAIMFAICNGISERIRAEYPKPKIKEGFPKMLNIYDTDAETITSVTGRRAYFFITTTERGRLHLHPRKNRKKTESGEGKEINPAKGKLIITEGVGKLLLESVYNTKRLLLEFTY